MSLDGKYFPVADLIVGVQLDKGLTNYLMQKGQRPQ